MCQSHTSGTSQACCGHNTEPRAASDSSPRVGRDATIIQRGTPQLPDTSPASLASAAVALDSSCQQSLCERSLCKHRIDNCHGKQTLFALSHDPRRRPTGEEPRAPLKMRDRSHQKRDPHKPPHHVDDQHCAAPARHPNAAFMTHRFAVVICTPSISAIFLSTMPEAAVFSTTCH